MSASPEASAPSRTSPGSRARGLHAAVLIYPDANGSYPHAQSAYIRAAAQQARAVERALPRAWRLYAGVGAAAEEAVHSAASSRPRRLVVVWMNPFFDAQAHAAEIRARYCDVVESGLEFRHTWWDEASLIDMHVRHIRRVAEERGLSPASAVLVIRTRQCATHASGGTLQRMAELIAARLGWPLDRVHVQGPQGALAVNESMIVHDLDVAYHVRSASDGAWDDAGSRTLPVLAHPARIASPPLEAARLTSTLSALVRRGRYPMSPSSPPLFSWASAQVRVRSGPELVMIGTCVEGALGSGRGPAMRYCDAETFRQAKRPHGEVLDVLQTLRGSVFREVMVWNTCNRLELYAWPRPGASAREVHNATDHAGRLLLRESAPNANILHGCKAHQHLLRTAAGLNSILIGDAEVLDQLASAHRTAEHAGTAGVQMRSLMDDACSVVKYARDRAGWGCFSHRYCQTALEQLHRVLRRESPGQFVVIGGSSTAASILETLRSSFAARCEDLTLIYRGQRSGALTRRLHAAIGAGRVINVDCYSESAVAACAAAANAVFLAGDHREPVLTGELLAPLREDAARRLVVVDFNTFGSTSGLENVPGVELVTAEQIDERIASFNSDVAALPTFAAALERVEQLIAGHAGLAAAATGFPRPEEVAA